MKKPQLASKESPKKPSGLSLNSLDPFLEKVSKLSKTQRILICILVLTVMIGPSVYFLYIPKHQEIEKLTGEYNTLTAELNELKKIASQLSKYQAEMKAVEAQFAIAKQALPENEEIPSLLTNISLAGQDSGLEFLLFKPEKENPAGFYAEIPVSIKVIGGYHELVTFYQKVARLSRLVNVKDIKISTVTKKEDTETNLDISCTAVTYKFLE
ncbi:MAG: type 4a pilus biogenesis protein PilO [Desulfococcaceae bacterium]